ncbi:unnamed protein product [Amoebophrya sp. A25]|nr:unnamed protein product [Amoebophrya sp. A25]|eukprot:GSA25T00000553001.1
MTETGPGVRDTGTRDASPNESPPTMRRPARFLAGSSNRWLLLLASSTGCAFTSVAALSASNYRRAAQLRGNIARQNALRRIGISNDVDSMLSKSHEKQEKKISKKAALKKSVQLQLQTRHEGSKEHKDSVIFGKEHKDGEDGKKPHQEDKVIIDKPSASAGASSPSKKLDKHLSALQRSRRSEFNANVFAGEDPSLLAGADAEATSASTASTSSFSAIKEFAQAHPGTMGLAKSIVRSSFGDWPLSLFGAASHAMGLSGGGKRQVYLAADPERPEELTVIDVQREAPVVQESLLSEDVRPKAAASPYLDLVLVLSPLDRSPYTWNDPRLLKSDYDDDPVPTVVLFIVGVALGVGLGWLLEQYAFPADKAYPGPRYFRDEAKTQGFCFCDKRSNPFILFPIFCPIFTVCNHEGASIRCIALCFAPTIVAPLPYFVHIYAVGFWDPPLQGTDYDVGFGYLNMAVAQAMVGAPVAAVAAVAPTAALAYAAAPQPQQPPPQVAQPPPQVVQPPPQVQQPPAEEPQPVFEEQQPKTEPTADPAPAAPEAPPLTEDQLEALAKRMSAKDLENLEHLAQQKEAEEQKD